MNRRNKNGQINFSFIARYPSAMLIAGGILFLLIGDKTLGWGLIIIGIFLHIIWLRGRFFLN
jgi:hypothetical protein